MGRWAAAALAVWLAGPAFAQQMTKAEEAAYEALWQLSAAAGERSGAGDLAGAIAIHAQMLALIDRELPGEPLTRAAILHNLAGLYADLGRLDQALPIAQTALGLRQQNGAVANALASSHRLMSSILDDLERVAEARDALELSVNLRLNDPQADQTYLIGDFAGLAVFYARTGRHDDAAGMMAELEPLLPQLTTADVARVFNALGRVQSLAGRPELAEAAYREAARHAAAVPRDDHTWSLQDHLNIAGNLASMLLQQGRAREAEPLFRETIGVAEARGAAPLVRAILYDGLGGALSALGQYQAAYDAHRVALDLRLATLPGNSPVLAASFAVTGETILRAGDAGTARAALARAVEIARAGGDRRRAAQSELRLAAAEAALGQPAFARARAAEAELAALLTADSPELVYARIVAGMVALVEGEAQAALALTRAAMGPITARLRLAGADATVAAAGGQDLRRLVLPMVSAAWAVDNRGLMDEAFQAAQWATMTAASRATQRMAARTAAADGELAALARQKQDLVNAWQEADRAWIAALAKGEAGAERARLDALQVQIEVAEAALTARFPDYAALVTPGVLSLAEVQGRLAADEALAMLVSDHEHTWVFAVSHEGTAWHRAEMTAEALEAAVRHLRADLDPTGPARAAVALDEPDGPSGPTFDRAAAHALYNALVAPVAGVLPQGGRVLVVADGALTSLPLAVLVASPPQGEDADPAALSATDWLAGHHAFATLPSVQALAGLRDRPHPGARPGFAGFGAPDFAGGGQAVAVAALFDGPTARGTAIAALPPLPGTRRELLGLARRLGAGEEALFLGPAATEAAVKQAALTGLGVVAFATHGLVAGDIDGLAEPALAFTPPRAPSAEDDGLLTASEAAQLRLDADWVILSACNTAAGDGTPGAEGLSGLASAFLYAGARGMLVSHWPVGDISAERLTQLAVARFAERPEEGQARALAAAMAELRADPAFAHPSAWAPFVVVGDGR